MKKVVGIALRKLGKVHYFNCTAVPVKKGDWVIVNSVRGLELGRVVSEVREMPDGDGVDTMRNVVSLATPDEIEKAKTYHQKADEAFRICQEKIATHKLPMKLVDVEYTLDGNKLVFYFSAEGRVDFRNLVRDLASIFKKRIELHQIGVRDEAKIIGGLGPCGRVTCCSSFLTEFAPVSIKMAKEQNLSLNPVKISGTCGRLMCCLKYEYDTYCELKRAFPQVGSQVSLPEGMATVVELLIPKRAIIAELPSGVRVELSCHDLCRQNGVCCMRRDAESRTLEAPDGGALARLESKEAAAPPAPAAEEQPATPAAEEQPAAPAPGPDAEVGSGEAT